MEIKKAGASYELHCSVCQEKTGVFTLVEGVRFGYKTGSALLYTGMLKNSWRTNKEIDELWSLLSLGKLKEFVVLAQKVTWDEVKESDPSYTYAVSQVLTVDSYCPECDAVYCKKHFNVECGGAPGYGGACWGKCPEGHKVTLHEDFMNC